MGTIRLASNVIAPSSFPERFEAEEDALLDFYDDLVVIVIILNRIHF